MKGCKVEGCGGADFCVRLRAGLNNTLPHLEISKQVDSEGGVNKVSVKVLAAFEVNPDGCALLENPDEAIAQGFVRQA